MKNIDYKTICTKGRCASLVFFAWLWWYSQLWTKRTESQKKYRFCTRIFKQSMGSKPSKAGTYIKKCLIIIFRSSRLPSLISSHLLIPHFLFFTDTSLCHSPLSYIVYKTLFHSKTYMDAFTRRGIFTQQLFHKYFHKQFVFTRRSCNKLTDVLHAPIFSQKISWHTNAFTQWFLHTRIFNAQQVLHTDTSSTHRRFFTQLDFFKSHAFELRLLSTHARHKGNRTRMHISSSAHSATLRTLNARNAVCHDLLCSKKWIKLFYTMRAHVLQPRHKNYYMEEKHLVTKMASRKIALCLHATTKHIWNIYWHRVHKFKIVGRLHIPAT